jgi:hypothetical protein
MKAGSEEEFQEPAVAEPLPELLHLEIQQHQEFTLQRILDSVNLDRLVGAIVPQHLLELE